jgi:hypothetical protein
MLGATAATLTELQDRLRAAAEKGLAETRSAYVKAKVAAEETADALETSYAVARRMSRALLKFEERALLFKSYAASAI